MNPKHHYAVYLVHGEWGSVEWIRLVGEQMPGNRTSKKND
jgi:hypothetical protein